MTTDEQIAMLEAKTRELVERNRRLANQIVGYQSRVNDSLSQVIKNAKQEALRSFADEVRDFSGDHIARHIEDMARARADKLDTL